MPRNTQLLKYIKQAGHTQSSFARELGLSRQAIVNLINKASQPSIETLYLIADIFELEPLQANKLLGFDLPESDINAKTPLQKLEQRVELLEERLSRLESIKLSGVSKHPIVNYVLGVLHNRGLADTDLLSNTRFTIETWNQFKDSGEAEASDIESLSDWLSFLLSEPINIKSFSDSNSTPHLPK